MKYFIVIFILLVSTLFVSCSNQETINSELVSDKVEKANFIFTISSPSTVKVGEVFTIEGLLKYVGEGNLDIFHGGPIIRFSIFDKNRNEIDKIHYNDEGFNTDLTPNETINVKREFSLQKPGEYQVVAKTEIIRVNGQMFGEILIGNLNIEAK